MALVSVPFGGVDTPSLALGLLAEALRRDGHRVDVHHLDLDVVKSFGLESYRWVSEDSGWKLLVGEWLAASPELTPGISREPDFLALLRAEGTGAWRKRLGSIDLGTLRRTLDEDVRRWSAIDWSVYDVVGFTVMFQQLNLSLRLARAIKDRHPRVRTVLGGINLENPTGQAIADRFPWLDAVFSGYADKTFPRYVATLPEARGIVIAPGDDRVVLDELPIPTYDEYVDKLDALGLSWRVRPQIPLETSRGCWWGMKHHCIFCGLNGKQMEFQDKSPARVVDEVRALGRYGRKLFIVDNILAPRVYDDLLPRLRDSGTKLSLRWSASLKANLTREQLHRLVEAGIDIINPGIESLSSEILRLMDKGETSIQNVWLLRACREMSVVPEWHLLYGFPGESQAAYREQATLIAKIGHLPGPNAPVPVALVRFSPMFEKAETFGITDVRPHRAYEHAFGAHPTLRDLAYAFEFRFPSEVAPEVYAKPTIDAVRAWKGASGALRRPRCELVSVGRRRFVLDTRGRPKLHRLGDDAFRLLERLDRPTLPKTLETEWAEQLPRLRALLADLEARELVLSSDGRLMRLVVFPEESSVIKRAVGRVVSTLRRAL
ncbi:MAG: RiPP maturation radical SAM C-methyltransferase [Polyangiales bacterium]